MDMNQDEDAIIDPADIEEEVPESEDVAMDLDDENVALHGIQLRNDSVAHFDMHKDSIFCVAQHPLDPTIVVTGGGDDAAYVWNSTPAEGPVLPASYATNPQALERESLQPWARLGNHSDSVNAVLFTLPRGEFVVTAGLEGRVNAYVAPLGPANVTLIASVHEVDEINWLCSCPHPCYENTFALGASDGSVWVYTVNPQDANAPLTIVQAFYLHTSSCTAGAWTQDGKLLATISEDSSLYVWDVFGEAAAAGLSEAGASQAVVALTADDERFLVDGGLYSIAISPGSAVVAVGGAEGHIRIVGLPRFYMAEGSVASGARGAGAWNKAGGRNQFGGPRGGQFQAVSGQAGHILASLQIQSDGVESLSFSQPPLTLLAAGSVDGSIAVFDAAHNFAVRRHIIDAHDEEAVIDVEFVSSPGKDRDWLLTSCGNDGVVKRWDVRGGTAIASQGIAAEFHGHKGEGEGGGVLGFVQGGGGTRIVTAGDDGVSFVFSAP